MLQVDFGIHGGFLQAGEEVGDVQKWVLVFLCDFIECSKVGAETEGAVFLSSEEDWSTVR